MVRLRIDDVERREVNIDGTDHLSAADIVRLIERPRKDEIEKSGKLL